MNKALGRKLSTDESQRLKDSLRPLVLKGHDEVSAPDEEDVSDLIDYALAMISNGKTPDQIMEELLSMDIEFCPAAVAERMGAEIENFISEEQRKRTEDETLTVKKLSSNSHREANALTLSGALGASRERNGKKKKEEPTDKEKIKSTPQSRAFEKLKGRGQRNKKDQQHNTSDQHRNNRDQQRSSSGGGRKVDGDSLRRRKRQDNQFDPRPHGARGRRRMDDDHIPPEKRTPRYQGENTEVIEHRQSYDHPKYGRGGFYENPPRFHPRGGRFEDSGRWRMEDDQKRTTSHQGKNDEVIEHRQSYDNPKNGRGGFYENPPRFQPRGGRFEDFGRGRFTPKTTIGSNTYRREAQEGEAAAASTSTSAPLTSTAASGRGGSQPFHRAGRSGRGFYRGGRSFPGRVHVQTMLASKTWVRKKEDEGAGGGMDGTE